jgi:hypothetical protein
VEADETFIGIHAPNKGAYKAREYTAGNIKSRRRILPVTKHLSYEPLALLLGFAFRLRLLKWVGNRALW